MSEKRHVVIQVLEDHQNIKDKYNIHVPKGACKVYPLRNDLVQAQLVAVQ